MTDAALPGAFRVVVIGGGVAGLVAARECAKHHIAVTVLEAADAVGGSVASVEVAGIRIDSGAESFATRGGQVAALASELGLGQDLVDPNPVGAWLQLAGGAVPLPKAALLGIPSSPLAADVVRAIGWRGALRAYLDRLMPVLKIGRERNLGQLVRKRMGQRVLDDLVAPITTGVYSAHPDELDIEAVAPGLNAALTRLGSLSGAVAALREGVTGQAGASGKAGSAVGGIRGGMSRLVDALADDLRTRGAEIHVDTTVTRIERESPHPDPDSLLKLVEGSREGETIRRLFEEPAEEPAEEPTETDESDSDPAPWRICCADGSTIAADAVIVAIPAALTLLAGVVAGLDEQDWPTASSVELVTLALDTPELDAAPRGTGVLVADGVPGIAAKALTHSSAKWPWLADVAGPGRHLLRLSYGRPGEPLGTDDMSDDALARLALQDASALLGVPLTASACLGFARTRWTTAPAHGAIGQRERVARVRAAVGDVDGVEVVGSWLAGTGLASVIPDALAAAARIRSLRVQAFERGLPSSPQERSTDDD